MARLHRWLGTGLAGLVAGLSGPLAAQSLWLPASDPVGIARSGAGVAFGQSLEAATLNPALLVTLRDASSAYLGLGMDMASAQTSLQSTQISHFTGDRNKVVPSFGAAWKISDRFAFGLKLDEPFLRHGEMSPESTIRFIGRSIDLKAERFELQAAWAASPGFSFGAGFGMARLSYGSSVNLRVPVLLLYPAQVPNATTNPYKALAELRVQQSGTATVPSFSLGFRWALNSRWTVAGTHQGALRGDLTLSASRGADQPVFVGPTGVGLPDQDLNTQEAVTLSSLNYNAGSRRMVLPAKTSMGVRHRVNQFFTWELDLRHVAGSSMELPSSPTMGTSSAVFGTQLPGGYRNGFGGSFMGECTIGRSWTVRVGGSLDPAIQEDAYVNPLISGSRSAAFSVGVGYRIWGGEVNVGYQFRQNSDVDSASLEGAWTSAGYRNVGTNTRVEGMGHLWSIGYKRSF